MKKILVVLLGMAFINVQGQNFSYSPTAHVEGELSSDVTEFTVNIATDNPEAIGYAWKTVKNSLVFGWDFSLCDYNTCYIGIPTEGVMSPISKEEAMAGTKGFFKITFLGTQTKGQGELSFYVYDENDENRGDTVSFKLSYGSVSMETVDNKAFKTYPNPANSVLNLDISTQHASASIYDMQGRLIQTLETNNSSQIGIASLQPGMYTIHLASDGIIRRSTFIVAR
jgi:hypothetical protein